MLSIIAAMDENRVIGKSNDLPWHIPEDLKLFKRHTSNKTVIMGRNTYESLKMPAGLPNRENIVISNLFVQNPPELSGDVIFDDDINGVLSIHKALEKESFVIGGATLYKEALKYVDYLYLSFVKNKVDDGDTHFPEIDWNDWEEIESEEYTEFIFKKFRKI